MQQDRIYAVILLFLLNTDHVWKFDTFSMKYKRKEKLSHNLGQNICKIFHVLAQLLFTKSKLELDFTTKMWICELSHELSNNLRLQKLENYKKIPDMLGFDGKFSADYPKAKFWRLWQNPRILCPRFQINIYLLTYLFTYLS